MDSLTIGLPRAMLYHRYSVLWHTFFRQLGAEVVVSEPTTKGLLEQGVQVTIDEACLATKVFMGHVRSLIGRCDYILVPRISNFGWHRNMCTKFEALYDMSVNIFRGSGQKFISYNVDEIQRMDEEKAFLEMGLELGYGRRAVHAAYRAAKKAELEDYRSKVREQEQKFAAKGIKILLAGHSYLADDAYIGRQVTQMLEELDAIVLRADLTDRKAAIAASERFSPTIKWEINREIVGSITRVKDKVDGLILLSAFPCGPDSMVNEVIVREIHDLPILTLVVDAQDGSAGVETRLESFLDIIRFKKGLL